jgi:hypothetical protein
MSTTPSSQMGRVVAIKDKTDADGNRLVTLDIQTFTDFSIIPDVVIDSPLFAQYIPVIGQIVMISRIGDYFTKVSGYFGSKAFTAPIKPGEALLEGHGGGFVFLNNGGDVVISDETLGNVIRLLNMVGITVTADALSLNIKGVGQLNITPERSDLSTENKIEFIKVDADSRPIARFTMTDDKIAIDGAKVEIGLKDNTLDTGTVLSQTQVFGTHSFCMVTGAPIPCAKDVRVKINPATHPQQT